MELNQCCKVYVHKDLVVKGQIEGDHTELHKCPTCGTTLEVDIQCIAGLGDRMACGVIGARVATVVGKVAAKRL